MVSVVIAGDSTLRGVQSTDHKSHYLRGGVCSLRDHFRFGAGAAQAALPSGWSSLWCVFRRGTRFSQISSKRRKSDYDLAW